MRLALYVLGWFLLGVVVGYGLVRVVTRRQV